MILASWLQSKAGHRHHGRCDLCACCADRGIYCLLTPSDSTQAWDGRRQSGNSELLGIPLAFDNSEQSPGVITKP